MSRKLFTTILVLAALLVASAASARAQGADHFVNLNAWPVDGEYHHVIAYPDTAWTWDYLGIDPAKGCPHYYQRGRTNSAGSWRNADLPEDQDWEQASRGNPWVACYVGHRGTDIATDAGAPVYAAADGTILRVRTGEGIEEGSPEDGMIVIEHRRIVDKVLYTWTARYVHLEYHFPVTEGQVTEGQLIGFAANQKNNTHVHFEVSNLWSECMEPCNLNPWGPVYLWLDDDFNSRPDPAWMWLPPAPANRNLVRNNGFDRELVNWLASIGAEASVEGGKLWLARPGGAPIASVKQFLPYQIAGPTGVEMWAVLSNEGSTSRYVTLDLRDPHGGTAYVGCTFSVPPHTEGLIVHVRGMAQAWANAVLTISVTSDDGQPALIDGVRAILRPALAIDATECQPG